MKNIQIEEGLNVTLHCEVSKANVPVEWSLGGELLENGEKYQIKQRDAVHELTIIDAEPEDSGVYTCSCREQKTKSTVRIVGVFLKYLWNNENMMLFILHTFILTHLSLSDSCNI